MVKVTTIVEQEVGIPQIGIIDLPSNFVGEVGDVFVSVVSCGVRLLTPEEREDLRQEMKEAGEYCRKVMEERMLRKKEDDAPDEEDEEG